MQDLDARLRQPIQRLMTDRFITVEQDSTLREAARVLRDRHVGLLLVTDGEDLVGVLSERDIVTALADEDDLDAVHLADRARGEMVTEKANATLQQAIDTMVHAGIRHLVVIDEHSQPVGVVSARDVLTELSSL